MVEALRRDTLQWEKITLKGKDMYHAYSYDDGTSISHTNTLALRGKFNTKNLGCCSNCGKIMTQKEFEKHKIKKMNPKKCTTCYYCKSTTAKLVHGKDGNYHRKEDIVCKYQSSYDSNKWLPINKENTCHQCSCVGGNFLPLKDGVTMKTPIIPKRVLTIKAFTDWSLERNRSNFTTFVCPARASLIARLDKNGYLVNFEFRGNDGYWDEDADKFFTFGGSRIDMAEATKKIMRGLYNAAD